MKEWTLRDNPQPPAVKVGLQHRGFIRAENGSGGGARFVIEVPLVSSAEGSEDI